MVSECSHIGHSVSRSTKILTAAPQGKYCFQGPHHHRGILICSAAPPCPHWLCKFRLMQWFVLGSLNKSMKKDPTLYPAREGKCICTPQHCATTSTFSFYLQADTGIWRKHVDIVFTKWINNNCFAPVNKMCCKLENLYWENREKLEEQNQYTNSQQAFHTTTTKKSCLSRN